MRAEDGILGLSFPWPNYKSNRSGCFGTREDLRKGVVAGTDLGDMDKRTGLAAGAGTETSGRDALLTTLDAGSETTVRRSRTEQAAWRTRTVCDPGG